MVSCSWPHQCLMNQSVQSRNQDQWLGPHGVTRCHWMQALKKECAYCLPNYSSTTANPLIMLYKSLFELPSLIILVGDFPFSITLAFKPKLLSFVRDTLELQRIRLPTRYQSDTYMHFLTYLLFKTTQMLWTRSLINYSVIAIIRFCVTCGQIEWRKFRHQNVYTIGWIPKITVWTASTECPTISMTLLHYGELSRTTFWK